jgi:hypothetical protein
MPEDISNLELTQRLGGRLIFYTVHENYRSVRVCYWPESDRIAISGSNGVITEFPRALTDYERAAISAAILKAGPVPQLYSVVLTLDKF